MKETPYLTCSARKKLISAVAKKYIIDRSLAKKCLDVVSWNQDRIGTILRDFDPDEIEDAYRLLKSNTILKTFNNDY